MYLRVFILTIILTSCTSHIVPLQNLPEPYPYCGLLNMPTRPYPAIEPRAYLGTYLATKKLEQAIPNCKENLFILAAGIIKGTPAEKAGLRDDDVILSLNNVPTCNNADHIISSFKKTIEQQKIGVPLPLEVFRNDLKLSLTITLDELPTHVQREAEHPEIDRCPQQTSLLENTLRAQNVLPFYNTLVNELYLKSNVIHNPGLIIYEKEFYPFQLNEVTYLMRHPLAAGAVAKEL